MKPFISAIAATTILIAVVPQPAQAADDVRDLGTPERSTAVFAGAHFRMSLDGQTRQAPTARLQLGVTQSYHDRRSASPATVYRVSGFELGASRRGQPALTFAGLDAGQLERRLGIGTGAAVAIGVGVGVIALFAVAAANDGADLSGAFED